MSCPLRTSHIEFSFWFMYFPSKPVVLFRQVFDLINFFCFFFLLCLIKSKLKCPLRTSHIELSRTRKKMCMIITWLITIRRSDNKKKYKRISQMMIRILHLQRAGRFFDCEKTNKESEKKENSSGDQQLECILVKNVRARFASPTYGMPSGKLFD